MQDHAYMKFDNNESETKNHAKSTVNLFMLSYLQRPV